MTEVVELSAKALILVGIIYLVFWGLWHEL